VTPFPQNLRANASDIVSSAVPRTAKAKAVVISALTLAKIAGKWTVVVGTANDRTRHASMPGLNSEYALNLTSRYVRSNVAILVAHTVLPTVMRCRRGSWEFLVVVSLYNVTRHRVTIN